MKHDDIALNPRAQRTRGEFAVYWDAKGAQISTQLGAEHPEAETDLDVMNKLVAHTEVNLERYPDKGSTAYNMLRAHYATLREQRDRIHEIGAKPIVHAPADLKSVRHAALLKSIDILLESA